MVCASHIHQGSVAGKLVEEEVSGRTEGGLGSRVHHRERACVSLILRERSLMYGHNAELKS